MTDHSGRFDATAEAVKIEHLAKERLDTHNTFGNYLTDAGRQASEKLAQEWITLDQDQRLSVSTELIRLYQNGKANAEPVPRIATNLNGEMIGLFFDKSIWDFNIGPSEIKLVATNANVSVSRNVRFHLDDDEFILDVIDKDPNGVRNGQSQQMVRPHHYDH